MSRYIEEEAIIKAIDESGQRYGITTANQCNFKEIVRKTPTADVAPKSEVDKWYHEYHVIKDALKQEKMYHRGTEKLADKYYTELQTAKSEVAREIFEEIEKLKGTKYDWNDYVEWDEIAELKKKYSEGKG